MADFLFNGTTKTITEPAGSGNTSYEVTQDLYSAWKRWVLEDDGALYPNAFIVEGGTPIGDSGLFTGTTYILVNGWKIQAANHNHQLTLVGNIYSSDGVVAVAPPTASATLFVSSTVGAQGVATAGSNVNEATLQEIRQAVSELHKIHGLKLGEPLVVSPGSRTAGLIEQTISTVGDVVRIERDV
jgi:hypothetical protein